MSMMPKDNRSFLERWRQFWFAPGDPTTLGFMRIATGLLVLYTHLAYSLDLQAFFGKFGWYGTEYIERERKEFPWYVTSFTNWDESGDAQTRVPEYPHRRDAVMKFIRNLPMSDTERTRSVRYFTKVADESNPVTSRLSLNLIAMLYSTSENDRRAVLAGGLNPGKQWYRFQRAGRTEYASEKPDDVKSEPIFPDVMLAYPESARLALTDDINALIAVLPPPSPATGSTDAEYVLAHIGDMDQAHRKAFVHFLNTLPTDPKERADLIDYLEYWNNDRRQMSREGHFIVSVWFHVTDPTTMAAIHAAILFIMVLFTIGFCTRVTSVLTWLAVLGYIHRTNQILFGMDTMMNILLVYLMIGNSGAALSVDRLIARYRAAKASLRRSGTIDDRTRAFLAEAPPSYGANFAIRLIQVHFCFIYLAAGCSKLKGPGWWNGTAFWDVMINPEFTLMKYPWFEIMVRKVAEIKPLYHLITMLGVWFTWGLEISFPFLIWTRLRTVMLWMGVLLHAGIGVLMGLNLFELLMMTMLLAYFPQGVIRDRLRGSGQPKVPLAYDPSDPDQTRTAAVIAAADVDGQVQFEPKTDAKADAREVVPKLRLTSIFGFAFLASIAATVVFTIASWTDRKR